VGELFTSFAESWSHFLTRTAPLESFFAQFPEDDAHVIEGWLIVPPPEVKREVVRVQTILEEVPGLQVVPHFFLHVWIAGAPAFGPEIDEIAAAGPFALAFRNVNAFHTAIVVEAHAERLRDVDAPPEFLPHMTIAVVDGTPDVVPVRDAVVPLRELDFGATIVEELTRVRAPAGRRTILQPWTVTRRLHLRR
jgi:hypothetical protein